MLMRILMQRLTFYMHIRQNWRRHDKVEEDGYILVSVQGEFWAELVKILVFSKV